jgi:hypothetical protein
MRAVLAERNRALLRDIADLLEFIEQADVPDELEPFKSAVEYLCRSNQQTVQTNLARLKLSEQVNLSDEIISNTTNAILQVRQMSTILVPPLLRDPARKLLSLKIVAWLHQVHPQIKVYAPIVADGEWAILPFVLPVYHVPLLHQGRFLYQPLLFHEFGHQLYRHHKPEMDDLVEDLQSQLLRRLVPSIGSNDQYYETQLAYNQDIASTWYEWIQEFFCDAVGFHIGGPCYLRAFSAYLGTMRKVDFHVEQNDLIGRSHPVTWLRVQFLVHRAQAEGFAELAQRVDQEWRRVSRTLDIVEDYYGMYDRVLHDTVWQALEDMLVEAGPRKWQDEELKADLVPPDPSPVWFLNKAWTMYDADPSGYPTWEKKAVTQSWSIV